jgi:hypothetical protein
MKRLALMFISVTQLNVELLSLPLSDFNIEQHKKQYIKDEHRAFLVRIGLSTTMLASSAGGLLWWMMRHRQCTEIMAAALVQVPEDKIKETFANLLAEKKDDSWRAWLAWFGSSLVSLPILLVRKEVSDFAYQLVNPYLRQAFKLPGMRLLVLPPHLHAYLLYHSHIKTCINDIEAKVNLGYSHEAIGEWLENSGIMTLFVDSLEKLIGQCEAALPKLREKQNEYNRALQLILEMRTQIALFDPHQTPEKARAFYAELEGKIRSFADLQSIR